MSELKQTMQRAREFIAANLAECCRDELEWQNTALLCDGKLREAAAIYAQVDTTHAIPLAQAEIATQAMQLACRLSNAASAQAADRVDAHKVGTLYQAVQRAAAELPEGWTVCLEIERDAGTVELIDPEGERKLIDGNDGYLCQAVDAAIDATLQAKQSD